MSNEKPHSTVVRDGSVRPNVTSAKITSILSEYYGLKVKKITELNGYDDKNFHIFADSYENKNENIDSISATGYVLKVINKEDSLVEDVFEAQTEMMLHLNKNNIKCPRTVLTIDGTALVKVQLSSGKHIVRLLEFIEGTIMFNVQATPHLIYQVGELTAKIDSTLENFDHPAFHRRHLWSLKSVPEITNYLGAVKDERKKVLVQNIIKEFSSQVLAVESTLRQGIIHGDINEQNIIVEKENDQWKVKAIIDLGDSHHSCYLYELALAMAYMIFVSNDIDSGGYVLAGYSSIIKVSEQEINLLRICVLARYCQSVVLGAYSNQQDPSNTYVLTTSEKGWELIEKISSIDNDTLIRRWKDISASWKL